MAFSSPWEQRHSSRFFPLSLKPLQRGHPPSLQFFTPRGVPLYPVLMIRRSATITAATWRFMQLLRAATCLAMSMKYWSQEGRANDTSSSRSAVESCAANSSSVPLFSMTRLARRSVSRSCWAAALLLANSRSSCRMKSCSVRASPARSRTSARWNRASSGAKM